MTAYRSKRAFTLVEVMIVVLLIGILMGIAMPQLYTSRTRSRAMSLVADLRQIESAKNQFVMANNLGPGMAVNDAADLVPTYIHQWPLGPVQGTYSANPVDVDPTFAGHNSNWFLQHCTGSTADSSCPL